MDYKYSRVITALCKRARFIWPGLAALLLVSCGYYSFKGSLPSNLKTVAIPLFSDRTAYPDIREKLTKL